MPNLFTARLDFTRVRRVFNTIDKWDIEGKVIDNMGIFYATDVIPGDIVYNDTQILGVGISRYKVLSTSILTNGADLYARVQWDILGQTIQEPIDTFGALIGRSNFGAIALPSITINSVDESFISAVRNFEALNIAANSFANRILSFELNGLKDNINTVFSIPDAFIPTTVVVNIMV
jgi:hypothetical protein